MSRPATRHQPCWLREQSAHLQIAASTAIKRVRLNNSVTTAGEVSDEVRTDIPTLVLRASSDKHPAAQPGQVVLDTEVC